MNDQEKIVINGNAFSFEPGETILTVAGRNDIDIPTLCHLKGASPTGNCRICVVEIENEKDLLPSCATLAEAGMVVHSESPEGCAGPPNDHSAHALHGEPQLRHQGDRQ